MRAPANLLVAVLALTTSALAGEPATDVAAEVERGVKAYNDRDLKYYEATLTADAVYIAEDGGIIAGKDRVLRLFTRIFTANPPRQIAVSDVATASRGDVAWARFKWTLTAGTDTRHGVATTLFSRAGGGWQVVQIQNTLSGHARPAAGAPTHH